MDKNVLQYLYIYISEAKVNIKKLNTRPDASNVWLVWDASGEAALIDASVEPSALKRELDSLGLTLKYILLTHAHFDHMLYINELAHASGATVALGDRDVPALRDPRQNLSSYFCATPIAYTGDALALSDRDVIRLGSTELSVAHFPGHTPGLVAYIGEDVAFVGDLLFRGSIGRTDFPGSSHTDMIRSLVKLKTLDPKLKICSGHGVDTLLGFEFENNHFFMEAAAYAAEYDGRSKN